MNSRALTKIQSAVLIAIIVIAAVGGGAAYVLWQVSLPPSEDIIIGVCADLDMPSGKSLLRGAVLAAEQINAEGGVLGRNFTVVAEDDDGETSLDLSVASNALTKLLTIDKADYVISNQAINILAYQDICAEHKTILFATFTPLENLTQRVVDNYDRYKYFFRISPTNSTSAATRFLDSILTLGNYTGFKKIGYLAQDTPSWTQLTILLETYLPKYGFSIVYKGLVQLTTTDFASNFVAAEASGAEILVPLIGGMPGVPFIKEYYDRQSPFVLWGNVPAAVSSDSWNLTEGKCEYLSTTGSPVVAAYPLTNKTVPTVEAYLRRWGTDSAPGGAVPAYDVVRFILPDAIRRAETTETEAVIRTLETTNVETSSARHWMFTSSHDVMVGSGAPNNPVEDYMVMCVFQWQNRTLVPVYPKVIKDEAGATYQYPRWSGPWTTSQTP